MLRLLATCHLPVTLNLSLIHKGINIWVPHWQTSWDWRYPRCQIRFTRTEKWCLFRMKLPWLPTDCSCMCQKRDDKYPKLPTSYNILSFSTQNPSLCVWKLDTSKSNGVYHRFIIGLSLFPSVWHHFQTNPFCHTDICWGFSVGQAPDALTCGPGWTSDNHQFCSWWPPIVLSDNTVPQSCRVFTVLTSSYLGFPEYP